MYEWQLAKRKAEQRQAIMRERIATAMPRNVWRRRVVDLTTIFNRPFGQKNAPLTSTLHGRSVPCPGCGGKGDTGYVLVLCPLCNGTGSVQRKVALWWIHGPTELPYIAFVRAPIVFRVAV